jgi:thioredoxin reductase (NADPH)
LLRAKPVIVVGAGDSGLQEALTLADFVSNVLVLFDSDQPTAQETYRRRVEQAASIQLRGHTAIDEVLGDDRVTGIRVRDVKSGAVEVLETAAVFVYAGLEPNTAFVGDLIELDEDGHLPTDIWMRTSLPGVFAAGDVRADSASQAITAAGDGATAACAARRYLDACTNGRATWNSDCSPSLDTGSTR